MVRPDGGVRRAAHPSLAAVAAGLLLLAAVLALPSASAAFSATTVNSANTLATDQLLPPADLTAEQSCSTTSPVGFRSATWATGSGSLTIATPPGTSPDDVLVAQVTNRYGAYSLTPPSGWNLIRRETGVRPSDSEAQVSSALYWRRATVGEPAQATFLMGGSVQMAGGIAAYTGVDRTSPVDVHDGVSGSSAMPSIPSVTTTVAQTRLLHFIAKRQEDLAAPSSGTQRWRLMSGGGTANQGASAGDEPFAGPGPTGPRSPGSTTSFTAEWVAQTVALRPVPRVPSADLAWTASPSSWASDYRLERVAAGTSPSSRTLTAGTTSVTEGPLENGRSYTWSLRARHGSWTSSVVTTTLTPSC